jgi:hypothetical protein
LIQGLLTYYFGSEDMKQCATAVRLLERAVEHEVNVPEVLLLIDLLRAWLDHAKKGLETYLCLLKAWLANAEVPAEARRRVQEQLRELSSRFREQLDDLASPEAVEGGATVADMQNRVQLLQRRISEIVQPRLNRAERPEVVENMRGLLNGLKASTEELQKTARNVESKEQDLMLVTGEFLLNEEERNKGGGQEDEAEGEEDEPLAAGRPS